MGTRKPRPAGIDRAIANEVAKYQRNTPPTGVRRIGLQAIESVSRDERAEALAATVIAGFYGHHRDRRHPRAPREYTPYRQRLADDEGPYDVALRVAKGVTFLGSWGVFTVDARTATQTNEATDAAIQDIQAHSRDDVIGIALVPIAANATDRLHAPESEVVAEGLRESQKTRLERIFAIVPALHTPFLVLESPQVFSTVADDMIPRSSVGPAVNPAEQTRRV